MIRPQQGPQEKFLASPADIAIYGGAAGGGKTWALLAEVLRHIGNAQFGAVIFRKLSTQVRNKGGLWDESLQIYPLFGATPREQPLDWTFPSGATCKFAHLQHDSSVQGWQGSQIPLIGFDELTHFSERQFFYMLTRNRSTCGIRPYVRATTNPDADSWVATFIAWWIDQDTGLPIPERAGVIRWFVRINEEIIWADKREELIETYPAVEPKSVTFIPAKLQDNKILMAKDPGYLANLMAQPLVERERLLGGNWKIKVSSGLIFNRDWFEIVDAIPAGGVECLNWDFAGTAKQIAKPDPDYTAHCQMRKVGQIYYILDAGAAHLGPAEVEKAFIARSKQLGEAARHLGIRYMVRWEIEPGSASKRENVRLIGALAPFNAKGVPSREDKFVRAKGLAVQAEAGNVKLLRGAWNERWLLHMHNQPHSLNDDEMDAASGSFNELARAGAAGTGFR